MAALTFGGLMPYTNWQWRLMGNRLIGTKENSSILQNVHATFVQDLFLQTKVHFKYAVSTIVSGPISLAIGRYRVTIKLAIKSHGLSVVILTSKKAN